MEQLGIEPKLLLAQIVNFCIIIFILSKLLYKPILGMLEKRKKEIAEGLELTEKMRLEEEGMNIRKQEILSDAQKEAKKIIEKSKTDAAKEGQAIIDESHEQANGIVQKGRDHVEELRLQMEKDVRKAAVTLASAMTKKLLSSVFSAAEQRKILTKHIDNLGSIKS